MSSHRRDCLSTMAELSLEVGDKRVVITTKCHPREGTDGSHGYLVSLSKMCSCECPSSSVSLIGGFSLESKVCSTPVSSVEGLPGTSLAKRERRGVARTPRSGRAYEHAESSRKEVCDQAGRARNWKAIAPGIVFRGRNYQRLQCPEEPKCLQVRTNACPASIACPNGS